MSVEGELIRMIRRELRETVKDILTKNINYLFRDTQASKKIEKKIDSIIRKRVKSLEFSRYVEDLIKEEVRKLIFSRETIESLVEVLRHRVRMGKWKKPIGIRIVEIMNENPEISKKEMKKKLLIEGYHPNYIDSALGVFFTK